MVKNHGVAVHFPPIKGYVHQNILDVFVPPVSSDYFNLTLRFATLLDLREIVF